MAGEHTESNEAEDGAHDIPEQAAPAEEAPPLVADADPTPESPALALESPAPAVERAAPTPTIDARDKEELATLELPTALDVSPAPPAIELAPEPDYPPPDSVPRPPPPVALKSYPDPVVDEVTPASGPAFFETKVKLTGKNLFRESIVRIGGVIAQTIGADEPRELRVLSPQGQKAGEVDVSVENPFHPPFVLRRAFRYEPLAPPEIVSVAPDHVATRKPTEVTVMGKSFVKGSVVLLNGKPAEAARFVSPTTIDVTVPPSENGKLVDVSVKNPDGATATARRAFVHDERFG